MKAWRDRANAPAAGTLLCDAAQVPADNGLEFSFGAGRKAFRLVLFRDAEHIVGYLNECPHQSVPFDFGPGVFCLNAGEAGVELLCPHHAALFRLRDGVCTDGPCVGAQLLRVDLAVEAGAVRIA